MVCSKRMYKAKVRQGKNSVYMAEKKGSKAAKIAILAATKQAESKKNSSSNVIILK